MKRTTILAIAALLLFFCFSCREEHVAPVNQLVKDLFCFKEGSTWTYYDSVSQTSRTMSIINYKESKVAPMPKGGRRAYEWEEYIEVTGSLFDEFKINISAQVDKDNTAIFWGYISPYSSHASLPLQFECDANNNFNIDVTYMSEYILTEKYTDIYLFEYKNIRYYIAKHTGLIRMVKLDSPYDFENFDLVLMDKNIIQ